jgi:hypothetical protein
MSRKGHTPEQIIRKLRQTAGVHRQRDGADVHLGWGEHRPAERPGVHPQPAGLWGADLPGRGAGDVLPSWSLSRAKARECPGLDGPAHRSQ